ncbi:MAG: PAS domain S-box protein [Nitrospinae bacterium]|nr:PAS domain S-box protein [Nitrospinota bacterium]
MNGLDQISKPAFKGAGQEPPKEALAGDDWYRLLFNSVNDAIFVYHLLEDGSPGPFIDVNDVAVHRLEYSRGEFMGLTVADISGMDSPTVNLKTVMAEFMEKKSLRIEWIHKAKSGRKIPVEVSSHIFDMDGKQTVISIARDITERNTALAAKRAAEELWQAQEEQLETILNAIPAMVIFKDRENRIVRANKAFLDFIGAGRAQVLQKTSFDIFPPEDAERFRLDDLEVMITGQPKTNIITTIRKEGRSRWVKIDKVPYKDREGIIKGVIAFAVDITQLKEAEMELANAQAEMETRVTSRTSELMSANQRLKLEARERAVAQEALLKSQERYKLLVEGVRLISWEADPQSRQFTFVSNQAVEILGYPIKKWSELDFWKNHIHPDDRARAVEYSMTAAGKGLDHDLEYRFMNSNGQPVWFRDIVTVTRVEGKPVSLRGAMIDINQRKASEEELIKAKETAEEATRLKDKFVSLVAHDLKSPLTSMVGLLNLINREAGQNLMVKHREMLWHIGKSGERIIQMINELLDISRLKTGAITPQPRFQDAHILAESAMSAMKYVAEEKTINIRNNVAPGSRIYADPELFSQVLLNLIANAIKFSPAGSVVELFQPKGKPGSVAVRDNGIGINPEIAPDLFRHEIKTSTLGTAGEKGTGLGLPYCDDIMKAHGGSIAVESEKGKGSVFIASLPVKKPLILLVEDEKIVRAVYRRYLEKIDAVIEEAGDGEEALDMMDSVIPDLVIMDIFMPVMGGFDLLTRLRGAPKTKNVPVIVVTSDSNMETREKAFRLGANDFISKLMEPADFIPRVRRFIY